MRTIRIVLTGGGSGGHVYPLFAVSEELEHMAAGHSVKAELHYIGPTDGHTAILSGIGIRTSSIAYGKIRRYASFLNIIDIPKFFIGLVQALWRLFWLMPDAIFSKGGSGALPVVLASWFYGIPAIIHESDAIPGLTNLVSSKFAKRIAVSFEAASKFFNPRKTAWVGNPVRHELLSDVPSQREAKELLQFNKNEPLALVLGGSQGSERINRFIVTNLKQLLASMQLLHQTGTANFEDVRRLSEAALGEKSEPFPHARRYQAVPFLDDQLKLAYSAADIVVSRAGSGAISEIAAFGKPAVLIPLPESANNHQRMNAFEFSRIGAAVVIEEGNLLPGIFLKQIEDIFEKPGRIEAMSRASRAFYAPGAAEAIAAEIYKLIP